jgi:ribosomal subunit interface protein
MQIKITGHNVVVSPKSNSEATELLNKLTSRFENLTSLAVILKKDIRTHTAEINTTFEGVDIAVTGSGKDMFSSIRDAKTKLIRSLDTKKGQILSARKKSPKTDADSLPSILIQEMNIA